MIWKIALFVVMAAPMFSADPALCADKPWAHRALESHVLRSAYTGRLSLSALSALRAKGDALFKAKFTSDDGIGRPGATQAIIPTKRKEPPSQLFNRIAGPEANSCASCHNEPVIGGAGNFATNVFVSEGFTDQGADSTDPQFSNERNTNHLMGSGLIELLAREMTVDLLALRKAALARALESGQPQDLALITKGVNFGTLRAMPDGLVDLSGLDGIDTDLVVRPFSQKGVMTSLRQFTINALNHHHGIQASERFGRRWTGSRDFDDDGVTDEMTPGDVSALVAWQAMLAPPVRKTPESKIWQLAADKGSALFDTIGCAACHIRALPLNSLDFTDPGPVDAAGTLREDEVRSPAIIDLTLTKWASRLVKNDKGQFMIPLFGDLKRHKIADFEVNALGNELLSQRFVPRSVFMTSELWGIASTAPYGHRGDFTTLSHIIKAHGGAARGSRDKFSALSGPEQDNMVAFLKTLVIKP